MIEQLPAIVRAIEAAGGGVWGQAPIHEAGGSTVRVAASDLALFITDNRAWVAKVCGVTVADLDEYEAWECLPRCGGTTASGRQCRKAVASIVSPGAFVELHRAELCAVHG